MSFLTKIISERCSMVNVFGFFNKMYDELNSNDNSTDKELIKYFKSEYGNEWQIELDKYLLKSEFETNSKAA